MSTNSLDLNQFVAGSRKEIISAREAVLQSDFASLNDILDQLRNDVVVKRIVSLAASSNENLQNLIRQFESATPGLKIIGGLSVVGAGAVIWGAEFALAPLIAICLIAYGISIALPATLELIRTIIDEWWAQEFG